MKQRLDQAFKILTVLFALVLVTASFYKATHASFTHDESYTYNHFVITPLYDILTYQFVSPNNHLLNTVLMKATAHFLGTSEFLLRLPNLIALLGFLLFSYLILRKESPRLVLPLFILVACNPYLLDFFPLARGNGLSYGFLMGSIYFFLAYCETGRLTKMSWSVVLGVAGVLSHFTLIYYFVALIAAANVHWLLERRFGDASGTKELRNVIKINAVMVTGVVALAILMTGPVIKLVKAGQLFYGGETGFWHDTVGTLAETCFYGASYTAAGVVLVKSLTGLAIAAILVLFLYVVLKRKPALYQENRGLWMVFLILVIAVATNIVQFYLLGTKLPVRRYGLLYYPLFALSLAFLLVFISRMKQTRWAGYAVAWILACSMIFHLAKTYTTDTFLDWTYEKETRKVMELVEKDRIASGTIRPVTMGITWLYEPTVNFYRLTRGYSWLNEVTRDGPGIRADYYYILRSDLSDVPLAGRKISLLNWHGESLLFKATD